MKLLAAGVALLALTLTGCSDPSGDPDADTSTSGAGSTEPEPGAEESSPAQEPVPEPGGPGTYTVDASGAVITAEVPVDASDPRVAAVEEARRDEGAPEATYVVADIDNRAGTTEVYSDYVVVITEDGTAVEVPYVGANNGILEQDVFDSAASTDLLNSVLNKQRIRVGARAELVYATFEKIDSIASVSMPVEELGTEVSLHRFAE